jgi:hypothetical protein
MVLMLGLRQVTDKFFKNSRNAVSNHLQGSGYYTTSSQGEEGERLLGEKRMDKERANSSGERFHYSSGGFKAKTGRD